MTVGVAISMKRGELAANSEARHHGSPTRHCGSAAVQVPGARNIAPLTVTERLGREANTDQPSILSRERGTSGIGEFLKAGMSWAQNQGDDADECPGHAVLPGCQAAHKCVVVGFIRSA